MEEHGSQPAASGTPGVDMDLFNRLNVRRVVSRPTASPWGTDMAYAKGANMISETHDALAQAATRRQVWSKALEEKESTELTMKTLVNTNVTEFLRQRKAEMSGAGEKHPDGVPPTSHGGAPQPKPAAAPSFKTLSIPQLGADKPQPKHLGKRIEPFVQSLPAVVDPLKRNIKEQLQDNFAGGGSIMQSRLLKEERDIARKAAKRKRNGDLGKAQGLLVPINVPSDNMDDCIQTTSSPTRMSRRLGSKLSKMNKRRVMEVYHRQQTLHEDAVKEHFRTMSELSSSHSLQ